MRRGPPEEEEDRHNCRRVLTAVLASTIDEEHMRLPTAAEYVFYTFIQGVIEYIGGKSDDMTTSRYDLLEKNHNAVAEQVKTKGETLEPLIRKTLVQLTEPELVEPSGPAKNYLTCSLYEYFKGPHQGIVPGIRPSFCLDRTFSPQYDWIHNARTEVIPSFTEEQRRDIEGIAKKLREIWTNNR